MFIQCNSCSSSLYVERKYPIEGVIILNGKVHIIIGWMPIKIISQISQLEQVNR